MKLAIVGAGWAGLSAAVHASLAGHEVSVYDMATAIGGRARSLPVGDSGLELDNGQHILIGAYTETLALMRIVGADPAKLLRRMPLTLRQVNGDGLALAEGHPVPAFARGVLGAQGWHWGDKLALLAAATRWLRDGFTCAADLSVAALTVGLPPRVRDELIDPLCIAALNTPAPRASATVFLRVLHDGLFGGRGASDLLLPKVPLGELLPLPAWRWLAERGARLHAGLRVMGIERSATGWRLMHAQGQQEVDQIALACSATEAARLARPWSAGWSGRADALQHEAIVTVVLRAPVLRLPAPMVALPARTAPGAAQFLFDLGALRGGPAAQGLYAAVASGASGALDAGLDKLAQGIVEHVATAVSCPGLTRVQAIAERRATFVCAPALERPAALIAQGLLAVGDYVEGPYPATLEGAVRSGLSAARHWGTAG